jgi:hypothetical protein
MHSDTVFANVCEVDGGHGVDDNCFLTLCPKYRMISGLNPEAEASFGK